MNATYKQAKTQLDYGKQVLYTGTPCQIAGLKSYLNHEYDNLTTLAIICHGTPSPFVWEKYALYCGEQLNGKLSSVFFRDKKNGWNHFGLYLKSESGKAQYKVAQKDPYLRMFLNNLSLRPSCYQSTKKSGKCGADIIIGDFWGVQNVIPDLADDKGTSLVLAFTEKGEIAVESVLGSTEARGVKPEQALIGNKAYYYSVNQPSLREDFFNDVLKLDFIELTKKYVPIENKERIKMLLDRMHLLEIVCKVLKK